MPYADIKTLIEKELNGDSLTLDEWERYNQWTFVEFPENLQKEFETLKHNFMACSVQWEEKHPNWDKLEWSIPKLRELEYCLSHGFFYEAIGLVRLLLDKDFFMMNRNSFLTKDFENLLSRLEKILADEQLEPLQDWKIWERELFLKEQALNRYFRRIAWYDKLEGFSNAKTE